jgi:aquaporin Z
MRKVRKMLSRKRMKCHLVVVHQPPVNAGIEVLASALLMAVILVVVYTNGLKGFSGIAIGGIVGLDIFFLAFISGASMNPARSLAPALLSGVLSNLWLYFTATFVGTSIVAFILRGHFRNS